LESGIAGSGQIRPASRPESGCLARWSEYGLSGQIGRRNLDRPDSGDINQMLSDSDTDNILMVVGCLKVKVDCFV
jgi:hypothetical protein